MENEEKTDVMYNAANAMKQRADLALKGGFTSKAYNMYLRSVNLLQQAGNSDIANTVIDELKKTFGPAFWYRH